MYVNGHGRRLIHVSIGRYTHSLIHSFTLTPAGLSHFFSEVHLLSMYILSQRVSILLPVLPPVEGPRMHPSRFVHVFPKQRDLLGFDEVRWVPSRGPRHHVSYCRGLPHHSSNHNQDPQFRLEGPGQGVACLIKTAGRIRSNPVLGRSKDVHSWGV